jgi:hypothetical protein
MESWSVFFGVRLNNLTDKGRIVKPALPPIDVPGNTPFQKMDNLFRAVVAVPKAEIDKREQGWQRARKRKRAAKS